MAKKPATVSEVQTRARLLYEKDKLSMREVAGKVQKSERTIANWADKGMPDPEKGPWKKGALAEKVQEKEEEGAIQAAHNAGLSMESYFRGVRELCEASSVITTGPEGQIFQYPKPDYSAIQKDGQGRLVAEFLGTNCEVVPNFGARKDGLKLFQESYPGLKAKDKIEVDPGEGFRTFFQALKEGA